MPCAWMNAWECIYRCTCECTHVYMYVIICGCMHAYVYVLCLYVLWYVFVLMYYMCFVAWLQRSEAVTGDSELYSLWTRYTGNSKTDLWDDPEIRTGSYSEDQMAILIQNHVISCECLLLYHFLIYPCQ